jgi:hypothetical protein
MNPEHLTKQRKGRWNSINITWLSEILYPKPRNKLKAALKQLVCDAIRAKGVLYQFF